jgi:gas vesicle protein
MSVFDELEQKARELAAEAKAALENPDEFLDKTRERVKEAVCDAKEDLAEFATDAQKEFDQIREKMADLFDCEPKAADASPTGEPAAAAAAAEEPPTASAEPA